jgi:surface protein
MTTQTIDLATVTSVFYNGAVVNSLVIDGTSFDFSAGYTAPATLPTIMTTTIPEASGGGTLIPWDEWWVGMVLCCADQSCAGDTLESWAASDCCCAGDEYMLMDFYMWAEMTGYQLVTLGGGGDPSITLTMSSPVMTGATIAWGDGVTTTALVGDNVHEYPSLEGTVQTITVTCDTEWKMNGPVSLTQWGTCAFHSGNYLPDWIKNIIGSPPTSGPVFDGSKSLVKTGALEYNDSSTFDVNNINIESWDVSSVTDMSSMFKDDYGLPSLIQNLSSWDVSKVTTMNGMFNGQSQFGQSSAGYNPIANWNTSSVTNMNYMFQNCNNFNQSVAHFDTSNVTNMYSMFSRCYQFDQSLASFDTSNVKNLGYFLDRCTSYNTFIPNSFINRAAQSDGQMNMMLSGCTSFNQDVSSWDVSNATDLRQIFQQAGYGHGVTFASLVNWDVSNADNFSNIFKDCHDFNADISGWDTGNASNMQGMFQGCYVFDQNISGWDVGNVYKFAYMFMDARVFNQPIGNWTLAASTNYAVTNPGSGSTRLASMQWMFREAYLFDQPLNNWGSAIPYFANFSSMFFNANAFNQPLNLWNMSRPEAEDGNWININGMFENASSFNQNLSGWNFSPLVISNLNSYYISDFAKDGVLSIANYPPGVPTS